MAKDIKLNRYMHIYKRGTGTAYKYNWAYSLKEARLKFTTLWGLKPISSSKCA